MNIAACGNCVHFHRFKWKPDVDTQQRQTQTGKCHKLFEAIAMTNGGLGNRNYYVIHQTFACIMFQPKQQ